MNHVLGIDAAYHHIGCRVSVGSSGLRLRVDALSRGIYRLMFGLCGCWEEGWGDLVCMITASHNDATYNGLKFDFTLLQYSRCIQLYPRLSEIVNDDGVFKECVESVLRKGNKHGVVYVGQDARPSSENFLQILRDVTNLLGLPLVELGVGTTPEIFSLVACHQQNPTFTIQEVRGNYVKDSCQYFLTSWKKLSEHYQLKVQSQDRICFDFSNGCPAVSYQPYHQLLRTYFSIEGINGEDFHRPNEMCGADFINSNYNKIQPGAFPKCEHPFNKIAFFDGDGDRLICWFKNEGLISGDHLLALYARTLKLLLDRLPIQTNKNLRDIKIITIGNTFTNPTLVQYLQAKEVSLKTSKVGILNMFEVASEGEICPFFQNNGHGGIFFSAKVVCMIEQELKMHPNNLQLNILFALHRILNNNSRGHGLHNFFALLLMERYLRAEGVKDLFPQLNDSWKYVLPIGIGEQLFHNGQDGNLAKPAYFLKEVKQMMEMEEGCWAVIRKSNTELGKLRVKIYAQTSTQAQKIIESIKYLISKHTN